MADIVAPHVISSVEQLAALFPPPSEAAIRKESPVITAEYAALISASPFLVLATSGPGGLDASPRGDPAGFVAVADERTLLLPERRGNNRIDSLRNLLGDSRVALLFLIPGVGRTLRINGRAAISTNGDLCASFAMEGKQPRSVIIVTAERVYTQCPKALVRSQLWDVRQHVDETSLPSSGMIMKSLQEEFDGEA